MTTLRNISANSPVFVLLAGLAAFGTYFCMYAFRKPYTAADFTGAESEPLGLNFKIALLIAQVIGYALSKFVGIKVISELRNRYRTALLIGCIACAEGALVGFGMTQDSGWSIVWLFLNGLPLGIIWGIVFSYLEGRRTTEVLGSVLCASFIVSSGVVKSIGAYLLFYWSVSPYWMPAVVGGLFFPPLLLFAYLLAHIPPPSPEDIAARTPRVPMDATRRWQLIRNLWLGLLAIVTYYVGITAYRDIRDNFAAELWAALGYGDTPAIFTLAELPIALLTLIILALTTWIRNNRRALHFYHGLILFSTTLIIFATYAFETGQLSGSYWMVLVGAGLYMGYVPLNAIYFDRLIAAFRFAAVAGFLIYVADSAGYAGSVAVLLYRNFGTAELAWLPFFIRMSYWVGGIGACCVIIAWWDFSLRLKRPAILLPKTPPQIAEP
jgi:hypothetical protein